MLTINTIPCLNDNYSYIIHDDVKSLTGVIDPSEFDPIDKFIKNKYDKLDYIFNTHHHNDHVGGNAELKKKYKSKIVASALDKARIPDIDIALKEEKNFKFGDVLFKIFFLPGHTSGHVAFYAAKEKIIFTGDTLFSLGCGRIFEGTYKQMFNSINKIKNLPLDTKIYCGHEYTKNNLDFCLKYENKNKALLKKLTWVNEKINNRLPTIPVTLRDELETNIFLRCENLALKNSLQMSEASDEDIFRKLRDLKDNF